MARPKRWQFLIACLLILIAASAVLVAIESRAWRRVSLVKNLPSDPAQLDLDSLLGPPAPIELPIGVNIGTLQPSYETFFGYYGGLDWSRSISGEWPFVQFPNRTWLVVEMDAQTGTLKRVRHVSRSAWKTLYPRYSGPGFGPLW